jgi:hypothetical protein
MYYHASILGFCLLIQPFFLENLDLNLLHLKLKWNQTSEKQSTVITFFTFEALTSYAESLYVFE